MGLGFSIDTPIKVAHYGIDSVVSIVDDDLIEKMRKVYSNYSGKEYVQIESDEYDYRAKRITAYLNLIDEIVRENITELKCGFGEKNGEFEKYIAMLPDESEIKMKYNNADNVEDVKEWILAEIQAGSIDVNIMTKVDKANYIKNEKLHSGFNDAHAALRGYANSKLNSSLILSAGMNPRLYSYIEKFNDFYPDANGELKKKIVIKVSDYRSALIQGKFLAKKGLWVSEYRIESGLNCGGHAFATDGYLMGPILEEFKLKRNELLDTMNDIYIAGLNKKGIDYPRQPLELKITAQGGVGTYDEQKFLLDYYSINSVGWGTPFLLVPEATNVDEQTLQLLSNAKEDDLYLSRVSPLGVPFNSIKGNTKDLEKLANALNGRPGSPCPKKYLQLNTDENNKPICTASRIYQNRKINNLNAQDMQKGEYADEYENIIEKACLCVGLATSVLKNHDAAENIDGESVHICPGPNLAYFSSIVSLKEMINHIYGRTSLIIRKDRPNMFLKELKLYLDYLKQEIAELKGNITVDKLKYFNTFQKNIANGFEYYRQLFSSIPEKLNLITDNPIQELNVLEKEFYIILDMLYIDNMHCKTSVAN